MHSCPRHLGITLAFLAVTSVLPASVGAQPPVYLTQWGSPGSGNGEFNNPIAVATDAAGNVYVSELGNNRIQKFTGTGAYLTQWGSFGSGEGQFFSPDGIATDADGDVYVVDRGNDRVQKFSGTGTYLTQWGSNGSGSGQFFNPTGVATDAAGDVYVADTNNHRIQKFTSTGAYLTQWGSNGSGNGQFSYPNGVATDAEGDVYVADFANFRVQKFTSTGTYLTQWGSPGTGNGEFNAPFRVATDADGDVYVVDSPGNHRIQEFTGAGAYLTQWGSYGSGDGQFYIPSGVATDAAGNIYVTDQGNFRVQKFGPAVTPVAMAFEFTPGTLNLTSQGLWVTGFLEPAPPFAAGDIDIATIRLNGTVPVDPAAPTAIGDHDANGVPDLMVKFNRAAVELTVPDGDNVPVTVTGTLEGHAFTVTDEIRVIRAVVLAPAAGNHLAAGSVAEVRWQTPIGVTVASAALLYSLDGGDTWSLVALGQPNTGSYDWTVPHVGTEQAKVAVVLVDSADETGTLVDGVLGVSEAFAIDALLGVADGAPAQFALRGVAPNPAQHALRVTFSLWDSKAATLALFDVSGRRLEARRVEGMGPGWHTVTLRGPSNLPAGLYLVRLTQGGRSLTTRAAVVR